MFNNLKNLIKKNDFLWKNSILLKRFLFFEINPIFILKKKGILSFVPNKRYIEIEITTNCNLHCLNCNRSCGQAPSNEYMSVQQIEKFIKESINLNWKWKNIRLIGGEPTLHPNLFEILDLFKQYKRKNPKCRIELATNGVGEEVKDMLSKIPSWIIVINSAKESGIVKFSSYNIAPIDLERYRGKDFTQGCPITSICGLGLTRYGYYPCGPGASVDRIFGFDMGEKNLFLINNRILKKQLKKLCRYCGHFKDNYNSKKINKKRISMSWEKAYEKYKKEKPKLDLF